MICLLVSLSFQPTTLNGDDSCAGYLYRDIPVFFYLHFCSAAHRLNKPIGSKTRGRQEEEMEIEEVGGNNTCIYLILIPILRRVLSSIARGSKHHKSSKIKKKGETTCINRIW